LILSRHLSTRLSTYWSRGPTPGRRLGVIAAIKAYSRPSTPSWQELEPGTLAVANHDLRLGFHSI
jgi:hypothetical protein